MKKLLNNPDTLVAEMCNGIAATHPELEYLQKYNIIKRKVLNPNKVTLISGGGSGHEPAHAGFVGTGMLDAAVCGNVFASPSQIQIYQAIRSTASRQGTLLIVKNYSGDNMNFSNAAVMAQEEGIQVEIVKVDDDIAVKDSLYTVGRRGVAGTVLVHKIAGAAAEKGLSLAEVKAVAEDVVSNVRTIGFALSSCIVPSSGVPTFDIGEAEMEYGVGIHGEPGRTREKMLSADELAKRMVIQLKEDLDLSAGEEVAILINGFGGTPLQELYLFNNAVTRELTSLNIPIYRSFVGNFMTSIDMSGASVSILRLNDHLKNYLDEPSRTPGFHVDGSVAPVSYHPIVNTSTLPIPESTFCDENWKTISNEIISLHNVIAMVKLMSDCIIKNEIPFCKLDAYAGDGDFGMSIATGFRQLQREWDDILKSNPITIGQFLMDCSMVIAEHCGGASGPIWGSAFRSAAIYAEKKNTLSLFEFATLMNEVVSGIQKTGARSFGRGAVIGDKTLIDALAPCAASLSADAIAENTLQDAMLHGANAAVCGAENTKNIVARMGRAGVVGERSLGYPDAGAHAIGIIFTSVVEEMHFS